MADQSANIHINLEGDIFGAIRELREQFQSLGGRVDHLDESVHTAFQSIDKGAKRANQSLRILAYGAISQITSQFGPAFQQATQGTYDFDSQLRELSAITGVVGDDLKKIGDNARSSAKEFGGSAADAIRSYTVLLSKVSPQIAQSPEALAMMGDQAQILGRTMQGDVVGAVNALSSALNQFDVDISDPIKAAREAEVMMNQMAAAAQAGAVEVPGITAALEQVGAVAKSANITFAETNAALQVLGKFGKEGAEGGIALRNVLSILQRQDFLPERVKVQLQEAGVNVDMLADNTLSLQARLAELQKIAGNSSLLTGMFGMENTVAIKGLLGSTELLADFEKQIISNSTAARDMADMIGESYAQTKSRIASFFEDIKLTMFGFTGDFMPWIDVTVGGLMSLVSFAPGIMAVAEAVKMLGQSEKFMAFMTKIATAATTVYKLAVEGLNFAFNKSPIGIIITGLGLVVAAVMYAWENFEGFRAAIMGIWEATKKVFSNIAKFIGDMLQPFFDAVRFIQEGEWGKAARALGQGLLNVVTGQFKFIGALINGDITEGVADAYAQGDKAGRASFAEDQAEEETDPVVIDPSSGNNDTAAQYSGMPFAPTGGGSMAGGGSSGGGSSTGGGSAVRNNNIHIERLVDRIEIHDVRGVDNLRSRITELVQEALTGAVRETEVAIS